MDSKMDILVIEDSDEDYFALQRAFEKAGVTTHLVRAASGNDALQQLLEAQKSDKRPSLILLDLNLPGLTGREVLDRIKQDGFMRQIPVIILSSSNDERDVNACYSAGASSYIRKPLSFKGFVDIVASLESFWLKVAILPHQ